MKKLFVCYHSQYSTEVDALAQALRLRGIAPWVDEQGGLEVGDQNEEEIRRAICEECWGFLLYCSPSIFDRKFITEVEVPAALEAREGNPAYRLISVPRDISLKDLSIRSFEFWGRDLTQWQLRRHLEQLGTEATGNVALARGLQCVAQDCLSSRLRFLRSKLGDSATLELIMYTRPVTVTAADLVIDAAWLLGGPAAPTVGDWERFASALADIKACLVRVDSLSAIQLTGSWHITVGIAFGFAFRTSALPPLTVNQHGTSWCSEGPLGQVPHVVIESEDYSSTDLVVALSVSRDVTNGMRRYLADTHLRPRAVIRISPDAGPSQSSVQNEAEARAIAASTAGAMKQAIDRYGTDTIHLFAAAPQALAVLVGRHLSALPPIQLYEWRPEANNYCKSLLLSDVRPQVYLDKSDQ